MQSHRIKRSRSFRPLVASLCSLGLLAGALTISGPAAAAAVDAPSAQLLHGTATKFLNGRNAELVTGSLKSKATTMSVEETTSLQSRESKHKHALKDRRKKLSALGERYNAARTEATVLSTRMVGAKLIARVNEKTEFDYEKIRGDEPPFTAFSVDRDFTYERSGKKWVLADVTMAESDGIPPVNEVSAPPVLASSTVLPAGASSTAPRPGKNADPGVKGSSADGQATTLAAYDYNAMYNYAYRYWDLYNIDAYRTYAENDCTNFISQIMYAGGWQFANTHLAQEDSRRWDYQWGGTWTTSYTWAAAHNWYFFATGSGRTTTLGYLSDLMFADVMQIDFDRNSNISHSMFVNRTSGSEKYLTYHSTDTWDKSLTSILQQWPDAWYYAHRT
ncbi:MAG: amidase domain-containing protein [Jatrophihabitantaceae bacterium]